MKIAERLMTLMVTISLVLGSVYLVQASLINAKAILGQWMIANAWEKAVLTNEPHSPWPWADTYPVAKLHVPHIAKEFYVLQGATGEALSFAPGMSTYLNDENELAVILIQAHRDTHFSFLQHLKSGDVLELEIAGINSLQRYVVEQRKEVKQPSIELEETADKPVLILSTCSEQSSATPSYREVLLARAEA